MSIWTVFHRLLAFRASLPCRRRISSSRNFRPQLEELESRLVPSSLDGNGPVVTGLSEAPGSAALIISFDGPLNLSATLTAQQLAFFQVNQLAPGVSPELITTTGADVPIISGTYHSIGLFSSQVTLTLGST